jgi:hypothetical protein
MDFKKGFSPGWLNLGGAALLTFLYWLVLLSRSLSLAAIRQCKLTLYSVCNEFPVRIIQHACQCNTTGVFFKDLFLVIIIPFIIFYVLLSVLKAKK